MRARHPCTLSLLCAVLLLTACGGTQEAKKVPAGTAAKAKVSPQAVRTPDKANEAQHKGTPAEASGDEAETTYYYDPVGKRDPFKSFLQLAPSAETESKEDMFLAPLERYSLDQLKLVGTVIGPGIQHALVEDDVGKGYSIRVGDRIGTEGGKVVAILKDRIVVEETSQDLLGNRRVKRVEKKLYTPVQGGDS
jgi:type IV pilus assembly protein PilP